VGTSAVWFYHRITTREAAGARPSAWPQITARFRDLNCISFPFLREDPDSTPVGEIPVQLFCVWAGGGTGTRTPHEVRPRKFSI